MDTIQKTFSDQFDKLKTMVTPPKSNAEPDTDSGKTLKRVKPLPQTPDTPHIDVSDKNAPAAIPGRTTLTQEQLAALIEKAYNAGNAS